MTDHQPDVSAKCSVSRNTPRTAACRDCGTALDVRPKGRPPERCSTCRGRHRNEAARRAMAKRRVRTGESRLLSHGFACACPSCTRVRARHVLAAFEAAATKDDPRLLTALGYKKVRKRNEFKELVDMWWRED